MSKTILAQVDGFTPLIDGVVLDVGIMTAAVFGKAWRFCQMSDGVCKASQDRIADDLGISRATVNSHLAKLTEAGYLEDITPDLLGLPHIYKDTGKAGLSISLTGGCQNSLQGGVKEFDTKKEVKESNKEREREIDGDPVFVALSNLTGGGLNSNTPKFVDTWREKHTEYWILQAVDVAKEKKARSIKYVDEVLISWEANGYPKTREEKVNERKILPSQKMTQEVMEDVEVTDEELKAMKEKSDRLVREALERAEKRKQKH